MHIPALGQEAGEPHRRELRLFSLVAKGDQAIKPRWNERSEWNPRLTPRIRLTLKGSNYRRTLLAISERKPLDRFVGLRSFHSLTLGFIGSSPLATRRRYLRNDGLARASHQLAFRRTTVSSSSLRCTTVSSSSLNRTTVSSPSNPTTTVSSSLLEKGRGSAAGS